jgi:ribose 5-phosphate isomerase A
MDLKKEVAKVIAQKAKSGEVIGLGTGSAAEAVIRALGERVKNEGLKIQGVSTSEVSTQIAGEVGIPVLSLSKGVKLAWGFDGADEVDPKCVLIKGKGGALLIEKIIAKSLPKYVIAVTEDKLVNKLGEKCALPIEVVPEAVTFVMKELETLGANKLELRSGSNFFGPLFTEKGNRIIDASFKDLDVALAERIKSITGVVEHGLFYGFSDLTVVCGKSNGEVSEIKSS